MNTFQYINILENKYSKHFQIEKNINILNEKIELFAKFKNTVVRTMVTEKDIIDSYETNEYCFVKDLAAITLDDLSKFADFLINCTTEVVSPHRDHKNSYVTGIIVTENDVNHKIKDFIRKFKYSRAYKFYLHGWSDVRLILVTLKNNEVITNKNARSVISVYQPTP